LTPFPADTSTEHPFSDWLGLVYNVDKETSSGAYGGNAVLEHYYQRFEAELCMQSELSQFHWLEFAGQRFLYVNSPLPASHLAKKLLEAGNLSTQGTKLKVECLYVRSLEHLHVFRFRLLVPNEKQFCCGNLCDDCFLLRETKENRQDAI
jgi:hypothetical protein